MLDVAASADAILAREPQSTRERMAAALGMEWGEARPWLLFVVACHDLGKACPGFQFQWPDMITSSGLRMPRSPNARVRHGVVSQVALEAFLGERGWPAELAAMVADAVGCHHGERASERAKGEATAEIRVGSGARLEAVRRDWEQARRSLIATLLGVLRPAAAPTIPRLTGPDFMLLAGLTSFADWIGSNEELFPYGQLMDCLDAAGWFIRRRRCADRALDAVGWEPRTPLSPGSQTFAEAFPDLGPPRPLQEAVAEAVRVVAQPTVLLIEAPMGEGKTEAAFFAHLELQRRFGHRGLYVALPTKATGNAMFDRTLQFLHSRQPGRRLDLQLLHGAKLLNASFERIRFSSIYDDGEAGAVQAGGWFTSKKRALLSEYGVGTIDQALVTILPVRHSFVRLWGLANRVVVFDEVHAYDAYTSTLLLHLLRWLQALGSSVVLLSATLSPSIRRGLARALGGQLPEQEPAYPRLSAFARGERVRQTHFEADSTRRLAVDVCAIPPDLTAVGAALEQRLAPGGMGLALVNTVQRAQELYQLFPEGEPLVSDEVRVGKRLADGTHVLLYHARFPADQRQGRERHALVTFGPEGPREGRRILVATQVAEQSLDLDFDVVVTDLAPVDLLLQRAGRLWRHRRAARSVPRPAIVVAGLAGATPPTFDRPLWWGRVYREDLLLRTWILLRANGRTTVTLPDEIDDLVRAVYEDEVEVPGDLVERMDRAVVSGEGIAIGQRQQADHAILGLPDDDSWNDPARFVVYDEDAPGMHRALMAQTRLGDDSVVAIPIWLDEDFRPEAVPEFARAREWFVRGVRLSRRGLVMKLRKRGIPRGWRQSSLLYGCLPLRLDAAGRWDEDPTVRLDPDLGVVYEAKEPE